MNIVTMADKPDAALLALIGTDLAGSGFTAASLCEVPLFPAGVIAMRNSVAATAKESNPKQHARDAMTHNGLASRMIFGN